MSDFEQEIKHEFINEALMNLDEAEGSFMELESCPDPKPLLDKIFRLAHNLKGGSRAVGFGDVAEFTHQLENLVLKIQQGAVALTPTTITTLLRSNDRLTEMLIETKSNMSATFNNTDILAEIVACIENQNSVSATEPLSPSSDIANANKAKNEKDEIDRLLAIPFGETQEAAATAIAATPTAASFEAPAKEKVAETKKSSDAVAKSEKKDDEVVRVNLSRIDLLNDYVGELIVVQSVIQQQDCLKVSNKLNVSIQQMVKISKDIQNLSMSLRMLPVKPLVQKLQRVIRDTAITLKKEVQFEVNGEHLDIDKSVLDRLADPLIHILRNAVDHGLETPEDRSRAGKMTKGRVDLSFINEGNHLIVEIKDDGKGINSAVLKKKALEKNIITENQAMTEKQLIHLIFHPGFSTKEVTSEVSGRGVGMDVVKTNVDKMGGQIEIQTTIGKGSTFRLKIPLTLAVIEGWIVNSQSNRFVVPANQIQETISLKSTKIFTDKTGIGSCVELRGTVIPLFDMESVLTGKTPNITSEDTVLIVSVNDQLLGLVVKWILRSQQVVIKPVGFGIKPQKGWIGSCVLGDGLPTLIVSPVDLLDGKIALSHVQQETRRAA